MCSTDEGYFRAQSPKLGDTLVIVFDSDDVILNRVKVDTGLPLTNTAELSTDLMLAGGIVEASPKLLRLDTAHGVARCADYMQIGEISRGGIADIVDLRAKLRGRATKCLQITVTKTDEKMLVGVGEGEGGTDGGRTDDVVFAQIAVYT